MCTKGVLLTLKLMALFYQIKHLHESISFSNHFTKVTPYCFSFTTPYVIINKTKLTFPYRIYATRLIYSSVDILHINNFTTTKKCQQKHF